MNSSTQTLLSPISLALLVLLGLAALVGNVTGDSSTQPAESSVGGAYTGVSHAEVATTGGVLDWSTQTQPESGA